MTKQTTATKVKCKHDAGRFVSDCDIYINPDAIVKVGSTRRNKVRATCNAGCGATRNIYLRNPFNVTFGRVQTPETL